MKYILSVLLWGICVPLAFAAPGISHLDFSSPLGADYFEIHGTDFGFNPTVSLGSKNLEVLSSMPTKIIAERPSSNDGTLSVVNDEGDVAEYDYSLPRPTILTLSTQDGIVPGATLTLSGMFFSPMAPFNEVFLNDVPLRVISASEDALEVELPKNLEAGDLVVVVNDFTSDKVSITPDFDIRISARSVITFEEPMQEVELSLIGVTEHDDYDVLFNGKKLDIIDRYGSKVVVQLPEEVSSGFLSVKYERSVSSYVPVVARTPLISSIESFEVADYNQAQVVANKDRNLIAIDNQPEEYEEGHYDIAFTSLLTSVGSSCSDVSCSDLLSDFFIRVYEDGLGDDMFDYLDQLTVFNSSESVYARDRMYISIFDYVLTQGEYSDAKKLTREMSSRLAESKEQEIDDKKDQVEAFLKLQDTDEALTRYVVTVRGSSFGRSEGTLSISKVAHTILAWNDTRISFEFYAPTDDIPFSSFSVFTAEGYESNEMFYTFSLEEYLENGGSFASSSLESISLDVEYPEVIEADEKQLLATLTFSGVSEDLYLMNFIADFDFSQNRLSSDRTSSSVILPLHLFGDAYLKVGSKTYYPFIDGSSSRFTMNFKEPLFVEGGKDIKLYADVFESIDSDIPFDLNFDISHRERFVFYDRFFDLVPYYGAPSFSSGLVLRSIGASNCISFVSGDDDCDGIDDEAAAQALEEIALAEDIQNMQDEFSESIALVEDKLSDLESRDSSYYGPVDLINDIRRIVSIPYVSLLDLDTDEDGLSDSVEVRLGTRIDSPDTDDDGIGDLFEIERGTDPLSSSSLLYDDQDQHEWAYDYILSLSSQGILNPVDRLIRPYDFITRAESLELVSLALDFDISLSSISNPFTDMSIHPSRDFAIFAYEYGLIRGYRDGTFWPDRHMSRIEFIAFLLKALEIEINLDAKSSYVDVSGWHSAYAAAAEDLGLISGARRLYPNDGITRAEVFKILSRVRDLIR